MEPDPVSLAGLINKDIFLRMPALKNGEMLKVKLVNVETGGIWISSDFLMETLVEGTAHKITERSMIVFVPYVHILAIYYFGGGAWISETIAR
jgi:hypothetical protein